MKEQQIERFFSGLNHELQLVKKLRAERDLYIARGFSSFVYIDPSETLLSKIIADLLRPDGQHGQGTAFLSAFLGLEKFQTACQLSDARIETEPRTSAIGAFRRRMDIVIDLGRYGIGIENKAFGAEDQTNQLQDYVLELQRRFRGDFALVYLSWDGVKPPPQSLPELLCKQLEEENQLVIRRCDQFLCRWIDACEKVCQSEKVRWFLRDFHDYVQGVVAPSGGETVMNDGDREVVLNYAARSEQDLEIALRVGAQFDALRKILLREFGDVIAARLSEALGASWTIENRGMFEKCEGIRIFKPSWGKTYWIELAPDKKGGQSVWLGVQNPTKSDRGSQIKREMDALRQGTACPGFPWYYYLQRHRDLGNVETLLKIYKKDPEIFDDLCSEVVAVVPKLEDVIEKVLAAKP